MKADLQASERIYRLYLTFGSGTLPLLAIAAATLVGCGSLLSGIIWGPGQLAAFGAVLTAILCALWFHIFSVTWKIVADEATGDIDFVGLLGTRRVHAAEIVSISPDPAYGRNLVVALQSGSLVPLYHAQFDGFHNFLTWLKTANPKIELRGC